MTTVGIIGFGSFGKFLFENIEDKFSVSVFDEFAEVPDGVGTDLAGVAGCDYVVLAIPVSSYDKVLSDLSLLVSSNTVIVDISSVKTMPFEKISAVLPNQPKVIMHPLFGPQSAAESFVGHKVVMCPEESTKEPYVKVKGFVQGLGLEVVEMSCEEHDRQMALVQGLTFFVARALVGMDVHDVELMTPSFKKLLDLADLERSHSNDLFMTIQTSNPFAEEVREKFVGVVDGLNRKLK